MEDQFQLRVGGLPAGPIRDNWDEAAQDAVSAGLAAWIAEGIFKAAIRWAPGQGVIERLSP